MAGSVLKDSMRIKSKTTEIRKASSRIINALKGYDLDKGTIFDIKLCTEEALRNAIKHGNKDKKDMPVEVSFASDGKTLEIVVEDKGEGFDYKNMPDPTKDENILKTAGRGVFLIRKLMDEVHFNDSGNKIRMVKYLRR